MTYECRTKTVLFTMEVKKECSELWKQKKISNFDPIMYYMNTCTALTRYFSCTYRYRITDTRFKPYDRE